MPIEDFKQSKKNSVLFKFSFVQIQFCSNFVQINLQIFKKFRNLNTYFTFVFAMNLVGISAHQRSHWQVTTVCISFQNLPSIHFCPKRSAKTSLLLLDHTLNTVPPSPFGPPQSKLLARPEPYPDSVITP